MRQRQRKIETGEIYGSLKVIEIFQDKPREYTVQCLRCGKEYSATGQSILNFSSGCPECRGKDRLINRYKNYTGQRFGYLEVLGFAGQGKRGIALAKCLCHRCGKETTIPYTKLLHAGVAMCANCAQKNLDSGHEAIREYDVDGTNLAAIKPDRRLNSNSTTGYKGVSRMRSGKYRAYIFFKHHQYALGTYDKIEDAIGARRVAEKEIFREFLEHHSKKTEGKQP